MSAPATPSAPAAPLPARITAPQGDARSPKAFQSKLINNMFDALQRQPCPPCLLRSPTGSGKTYMLTRVLQRVSEQQPTLWLWFVPFVNLVAQTIDSLDSEGVGLTAVDFGTALNEQPAPGLVLISTVQGVASAKARLTGYSEKQDDEVRSIAAYVTLARSQGLDIGLVVDEAHIALKSTTEFGQFVHWLHADYVLMASATPRDAALSAFIHTAGYSACETFSVSRADVVAERLNKAWLLAMVYDLQASMQSVTDLKLTVLRRAWARNQQIERDLRARGLATVPLLLVQVGNGAEAIGEAHEFLMRELKIPAHAIGVHTADLPDPVMMAAIANDTRKQVLVFKQSAGTGFDAPRAFVLASTKHVNDPDFATQFIGRVMRVTPELQKAFPDAASVPPELDTAYVFLANELAQPGFAAAAQAIKNVQSQLEGQTEQLVARPTALGGVSLSNRPTAQVPVLYDLGLLPTRAPNGTVLPPVASHSAPLQAVPVPEVPLGSTAGLFDSDDDEMAQGLDTVLALAPASAGPVSQRVSRPARREPLNREELFAALEEAQLRTLPRQTMLAAGPIPNCFMTEVQPVFDALALDVCEAARQLVIDPSTKENAVKAALNRMSVHEIRTELFTDEVTEDDVQVITDHEALLEHTCDALATLGLEEQDCTDVIRTLSLRLLEAVEQVWEMHDEDKRPSASEMRGQSRQAACWVIHKQFAELQEALHKQWATRAQEVPAQPLPDALLLPEGMALLPSRKNIYGVLYPSTGEAALAREALAPLSRAWFKNETYLFSQSAEVVSVACVDATYELNESELNFARALDRADFVQWWHRNPQGKPFSVALLRGDSKNLFYPDFVVCMTHTADEPPLLRLIDPKHDTKDAVRKSIHQSNYYGKVLFLTKDASRFRIVNDDGSVDDVVDFDNLSRLKSWMRNTQPAAQRDVSI